MNLVTNIKGALLSIAFTVILLLTWSSADAQAPAPRRLNDDQVEEMLNNERWTFGRKDMRSNRKNRNGGGRRNGGGGGGGGTTGSGSDGSTRSDRTTNGDGEYYWDDRDDPNGSGQTGSGQVNPEDIRDNPGSDDNPGSRDDSYSPPMRDSYTPPTPKAPTDTSGIIGALKYILIGLGVVLLVYLILQARGSGAFKGKKAKVKEESEFVDFEEDIHEIEFVDEIELAVRNGDFRKAIRLRFLNALKDLSDVSLIRWKINKTNYDYIGELGGHPIQKGFMNLTTVYEYCWYGEFNISKDLYQKVAVEFNQFNSDLDEVVKG